MSVTTRTVMRRVPVFKHGDHKKVDSYMRTTAHTMWGHVNYQRGIVPGVKLFDCAGHGGYLVDTVRFPLSPALERFQERYDGCYLVKTPEGRIPYLEDGNYALSHFHVFEEDCGWAVLFYYHPELVEPEDRSYVRWGGTPRPEGNTRAGAIHSVRRWHPELLKDEDKEAC